MQTVQLLISTFGSRINQVEKVLLPPEDGVSYIISHQKSDGFDILIPESLQRDDVSVFQIEGRGLARNRNNCLVHASADIVMILDDDVTIKSEYIQQVRDFFENEDVDIACSKIKTPDNQPTYKTYPEYPVLLDSLDQFKSVSSIEMSIRLKSVSDKSIFFDERFGLGTKLSSGEEFVFLVECWRQKLKIKYFPVFTVEHDYQSSGKDKSFLSDEKLMVAGAHSFYLFGNKAYIYNFLSVFRRFFAIIKSGINPVHFLKMKNAGSTFLRFY
jgi:glycosyltransferase involved in cell wall biosynthesis